MLTRSREAQASASPDIVLSPLPCGFVRAVLLLLPVDTRLRCSEVSRAWRALLADTSLFCCLNLSIDSGCARFSLPLLRADSAKAGGQLRTLDVTGQRLTAPEQFFLLESVSANAATLTELRVGPCVQHFWSAEGVRALIGAAPACRLLEASVKIYRDRQVARAMLRNEPPFEALRLRRLWMHDGLTSATEVVAFCLDMRFHASLEELALDYAMLRIAAALDAVVDACISLRLRTLILWGCHVVPMALPELTRLIAAGALRYLCVRNNLVEIFDEAHESTRLFVAAVRASAMTKLDLDDSGDLPANVVEAAAFINARTQ